MHTGSRWTARAAQQQQQLARLRVEMIRAGSWFAPLSCVHAVNSGPHSRMKSRSRAKARRPLATSDRTSQHLFFLSLSCCNGSTVISPSFLTVGLRQASECSHRSHTNSRTIVPPPPRACREPTKRVPSAFISLLRSASGLDALRSVLRSLRCSEEVPGDDDVAG